MKIIIKYQVLEELKARIKNGKPIVKLDINDNILELYDTIKEASMKNNIKLSNISNVCKERQKTAGGFKWKYKKKELASPI